MIIMVMAVMVVMGGSQDRKDRQKKLTVKLCVVVVGCIFFLTTCQWIVVYFLFDKMSLDGCGVYFLFDMF